MKRCEVRCRAIRRGKEWKVYTAVGARQLCLIQKDEEGLYYYRMNTWRKWSRPYKTQKRAIEAMLERV